MLASPPTPVCTPYRSLTSKILYTYREIFGHNLDVISHVLRIFGADIIYAMKYGFVKVATTVPAITVADCAQNTSNIIEQINNATHEGTELQLFPELCITSSCCGDLFIQPYFLSQCEVAIKKIAESTKDNDIIVVVGAPVAHGNSVYNCAIVMHNGKVVGIVPKKALGRLNGNDESRWFASSSKLPANSTATIAGEKVPFITEGIFHTNDYTFAIEIGNESSLPIPAGARLATAGALIILNPASDSEEAGTNKRLRKRIEQQSERYYCAYMYSCSGWGESTSSSVHSGYNAIAECGEMVAESKRFITEGCSTITEVDVEKATRLRRGNSAFATSIEVDRISITQQENRDCRLTRSFNKAPFIPNNEEERKNHFEEIFTIQATALARRIVHTHAKTAVIGISGGLDSTLALLVTAKAFDITGKPHSDITAVTMPGFGTSGRTYNNAMTLMQRLGTTTLEISIKEACIQHFKDIAHDMDQHDITYENAQARERTQILMDIANKQNGIVIGTGDLSELALGWATYNGDHMSMYGVNASVPKTLMQHIVRWVADNYSDREVAETLLDIIDTPISPELIPADDNGNIKQKTEDLVGPYELHDFFLFNFICYGFSPDKIFFMTQRAFEGTYDNDTIKKWLSTFMRRFFMQQFKRSCMPDSPKTCGCSLSPQDGWTMTSDTSGNIFTEACKNL